MECAAPPNHDWVCQCSHGAASNERFSSIQLLGPIGAYLDRYPCLGRTPTISTSTELESTIHLKAADSTKWVIAFEMSAMDRLDMGSSI